MAREYKPSFGIQVTVSDYNHYLTASGRLDSQINIAVGFPTIEEARRYADDKLAKYDHPRYLVVVLPD